MKAPYLILGIPVFVFLVVAFVLDIGSLLPLYPDRDLTPFMAARSLAIDHDLAYTRGDSDRFFREHLYRPYPLLLVQKKIVASSGQYKNYFAYYCPDVYVFALVPFVSLFSVHGVLLFHALLIGWIFFVGYSYYGSHITDPVLRSINTLTYYSLTLIPILYLLPSHHLFLFAVVTTAIYCGLKRKSIWSALFVAIAFSSQPWSILLCIFLITCWQNDGAGILAKKGSGLEARATAKFGIVLLLFAGAVWGIERLMYPPGAISDPRWMTEKLDVPLIQVWDQLPSGLTHYFGALRVQRLIDFVFGRSTGFFVYGFAACATLFSAVWLWQNRMVRNAILFVAFFLLSICLSDVSSWYVAAFANDFAMILCALSYFVMPLVQPWSQYVLIVVLSAFLAGPLLMNPLGAITSRNYYVQSFPYRYFPIEISLAGKVGIMRNPAYQLHFTGGTVYFLNDNFYTEESFFWVRGESRVEILMELDQKPSSTKMIISNGPFENRIVIHFGKLQDELTFAPANSAVIDLAKYQSEVKEFDGDFYLHGTIEAKSGFVPKLFSRDNLDYRYLGCQIHIIQGESVHAP